MALTITVYSGFSKRINSTKQPTGGQNVDVVLKHPTSVIRPSFVISGFNTAWNYIQWGNRYYYVADIIILTATQAEYVCELDVLATYKTQIGSTSQYVLRCASASDPDIIDAKYPAKSNPTGRYYEPPIINSVFNDTGTFVLGVKNGKSNTGLTFYAVDATNMAALMDYMFSDIWLDASDITKNLQKMLINPMDYISLCYWFPITLPTQGAASIYFGYWNSGASGTKLEENVRIVSAADTITLYDHPQIARGNYLNGAPYTRLTADVFGFGRIPLDADLFVGGRSLIMRILVDLFTGLGELIIEGYAGRAAKVSSMVGVPVQLSQTTQDLIKPVVSAVNAGARAAGGDYVGAGASIFDAIASAMPQVQTSGSTGSKIAYTTTPRIYQEFYSIVDEDNATLGRPLCKIRTINTLSGFIQCDNVDIEDVGTSAEKRAIVEFMEGGFFYE